ncbi:hypothetical protein [Paenibacillus herberti]|uniref:Uncharacterized protein n=1 Tax=Paenibacillus herberti TaxID=1619309 RepID=A0A229P167_9BACL|nr:hypothetical protein [Paenibacillus herberti]OXM15942.1 hypothetical protein CGZ75_04335 [Paenibacillus herberti]
MNNRPASSAKSSFSNPGIILILFILLVVVVGSVPKTRKHNGSSSEVLSTAGFIVRNDTFYYTLVLTGLEGETQLPEIIFMPPGGSVRFEVPSRAFETTRANIKYTVFDEDGESLGDLTFTLVNPIVFPTFSNIKTTAPINTQKTSTAYPDVTPLLIVTEKY